MREIKFRGKLIAAKNHWVYGAYIPAKISSWEEDTIFDGQTRWVVDPNTIGQYTGYKDVDGKEIYEGDILKMFDEPDVGGIVVRFGECEGPMYGVQNYGFYVTFLIKELNLINRQDFLFWYRKGVKVIGNIYDNPEEGK